MHWMNSKTCVAAQWQGKVWACLNGNGTASTLESCEDPKCPVEHGTDFGFDFKRESKPAQGFEERSNNLFHI